MVRLVLHFYRSVAVHLSIVLNAQFLFVTIPLASGEVKRG